MRRIVQLFALLVAFHICRINAQPVQELRGVWITNVASTVMNSDAAIAEAMDYLASAGFNVVFPVVWNGGYTLYPSDVMKGTFGTEIHPSFAGRDPLDRIIIEAHRNGMEVIPWFEYGFAAYYAFDASDIGPILTAKPAWALRNSSGQIATKNGEYPQFVWMSGIHPEVQDFMISLVTEVVDRYDVDGVQGDDRLPAMPVEGGYETSTADLYRAEHAGASPPTDYRNSAWMRWRADKLNAFFARLRDSVKVRGEHLILSTGPSEYAWGYPEYLQDSKTWLDSSIVDHLIPQLYPSNRSTPQETINEYTFRLDRALGYVQAEMKDRLFAGVLARVGSYNIEPSTAVSIIGLNRARGVMGETYFFYEGLRSNSNAVGDALKAGPYNEPAILPYRNGTQFRLPGVVVNESDPSAIVTGSWLRFNVPGYDGFGLVTLDTGSVKSISYAADVPEAGVYHVFAYRISAPSPARTSVAPYDLIGSGGSIERVTMDQTPAAASAWVRLGAVHLDAGMQEVVRVSNEGIGAGKTVVADAVMLLIDRSARTSSTTSVGPSRGQEGIPARIRLEGNFPNPFNPSTTIRYSLAESMIVRLEIVDVLGRRVALVDDGFRTAGTHAVSWSANVASGVYVSRLTASPLSGPDLPFMATQRMILLR